MTAAELWVYGSEFLDREQTQKIVRSFPTLPNQLYCQMDRTDELVRAGQIPSTIRLSRPIRDSLDTFFADDDRFNALTNAYLYYGGEVPGSWDIKVLISPHTFVWRQVELDSDTIWEKELNARGFNRWHHLAAIFYSGTSYGKEVVEDYSVQRLPDEFLNYGQILADQIIPAGQESNYLLGLRHGENSTPLLSKDDFTNLILRNRLLRNL